MSIQALSTENNNLVIDERMIRTVDIYLNSGQVPGIPANPKYMDEKGSTDLRNSLMEDPEYLHVRKLVVIPYAGAFVALCGNGRLRECIGIGIFEVPCIILNPKTPVEKIRRYMVKDNITNGKWDFDLLANDFEVEELEHLGLDLPFMHVGDDEGGTADLSVDEKIKSYKLTLECGSNSKLYEQLKLKIQPVIDELLAEGLEVRG